MNFEVLSIILSFIFGLAFVYYLRRFDQYDQEPYLKMALTTLIGGVVSVAVCTVLYIVLDRTPFAGIETRSMLGALMIVGPVEEVAKLVGLLAAWPFIRREINEVNDGLVYMACVALGFSLIENWMYANGSLDTHYLLYYRLFVTSPAHIIMSLFIGMAFFRVKFKKANAKILLYAIIWSSIIHGLYDGFLFEGYAIVAYAVLILAIQQAFILVRVANVRSPFKRRFTILIKQKQDITKADTVCPSCHTPQKNNLIKYRNIKFYDCKNCRMMYGERKHLIRLYHYYIPPMGIDLLRLRSVQLIGRKARIYSLRKLFFFKKRSDKLGYFNPANFLNLLQVYHRAVIREFKGRWYSPGRYIAVFEKTRVE